MSETTPQTASDTAPETAPETTPETTPALGGNAGADLGAAFDAHMTAEFADHSLEDTMHTMGDDPLVMHVPTTAGGRGTDAVTAFYRDRFIFCWPEDTDVQPITRTIADDRVVDEVLMTFTHDREVPIFLPGVEPTGRQIRIPIAVVVGFKDGAVAYERIYWDQASVLVQAGLLDESRYALGSVQADRVIAGAPVDPLR